jgi:hypothetical protein
VIPSPVPKSFWFLQFPLVEPTLVQALPWGVQAVRFSTGDGGGERGSLGTVEKRPVPIQVRGEGRRGRRWEVGGGARVHRGELGGVEHCSHRGEFGGVERCSRRGRLRGTNAVRGDGGRRSGDVGKGRKEARYGWAGARARCWEREARTPTEHIRYFKLTSTPTAPIISEPFDVNTGIESHLAQTLAKNTLCKQLLFPVKQASSSHICCSIME